MANSSKRPSEFRVHRHVAYFYTVHVAFDRLVKMMKKVLIIEDETDLIKLLRYNMEKEGFKVSYATDGSVALAEVRRDTPDVVILDLMLPGLSGLEVCGQLRRSDGFSRIPILIRRPEAKKRTALSDSNSARTITSRSLSACVKWLRVYGRSCAETNRRNPIDLRFKGALS